MKRFVLSADADQDLAEIAEQIGTDSLSSAERVIENLYKAMGRLAEAPGIGHWREDLADRKYRFFLVYSYLVIYQFDATPLLVVRVIHAARDVSRLLDIDSPAH